MEKVQTNSAIKTIQTNFCGPAVGVSSATMKKILPKELRIPKTFV